MKTKRLSRYRTASTFAMIAAAATVAEIVTGEYNLFATIFFGTLAVAETISQTRDLWREYKTETAYHGKHAA